MSTMTTPQGRDRRTFSDRHRQRVREGNRQQWRDWATTHAALDRAEADDQAAAVARGEAGRFDGMSGWVHLALTFLTAGLWLPVWLLVEWRNRRRYRRTPWGDADRTRRANARRELRGRNRSRSRAVAAASWNDLFDRRRSGS